MSFFSSQAPPPLAQHHHHALAHTAPAYAFQADVKPPLALPQFPVEPPPPRPKKSHKRKKEQPPPSQLLANAATTAVVAEVKLDPLEVGEHCALCEYSTDKRDRMRRHVRTVHLKQRPYACGLCAFATARKDKLQRHLGTVHSAEKPFKCDFCAHTTNRRDKLKVHVDSVHLKSVAPSAKSHKRKSEAPTSAVPQAVMASLGVEHFMSVASQ